MELKSSAKLNIGLHVHSIRSDGFHNISTLFQEISLYDLIKTYGEIITFKNNESITGVSVTFNPLFDCLGICE